MQGQGQDPEGWDGRSDDDRDVGWGEAPDPSGRDDDERLLREVPPHHGD